MHEKLIKIWREAFNREIKEGEDTLKINEVGDRRKYDEAKGDLHEESVGLSSVGRR